MTNQQKTKKIEKKTSKKEQIPKKSTSNNKLEEQIIQKDFETLKTEYNDIKETLQRLQAEFTNYRKRNEEDQKRFILMSNIELLKKLLPVMDNFEIALKAKTKGEDFVKGMEMIYTQLKEILGDEGLMPINASGKFDPQLHEAVLTEESELEPNHIIQELQKGYKINDRVIRHSKVKISKKIGGN